MLGDLFSAGANIIGGILGKDSADSAREENKYAMERNFAAQREFAQMGLQWKVNDAKAAGIHPIYALGGSGASFSPVSANFQADTSLPNAMAAAGQDLGRAINKTRTEPQRLDAFTQTAQRLSLEKAGLENDLLRSEIASKTARLRQDAGPPFPAPGDNYQIPGQAQSGSLIKTKPLEVTPGVPTSPQSEGGSITDVGYARTKSGYAPVPSKDVKERIEDQIIPEIMWAIRNNVFPTFGHTSPPPFEPGPGKEWWFNPFMQEYQIRPARPELHKPRSPRPWIADQFRR